MKVPAGFALIALAFVALPLAADVTVSPINLPATAFVMNVGPDGNLWALTNKNSLGRLTPGGTFTEFPLQFSPPPHGGTVNGYAFTSGIDRNLWVASITGHIERVTPSGAVTDFTVGPSLDLVQGGVVSGADGALWFFDRPGFTFPAPNWSLGRIDIYGQVTTYSLGLNDNVTGLVSGGDGNLWFINLTKNQVVKFSLVTKSVAGTFAIPSASNQNGDGQTILAWDGNVWFTRGTSLDRITPDGTITEFHVPSGGQPAALLMSGDNTIWFTEPSSGKLGQLVLSSITAGGSATISESSANLSDVMQLFLLPPAFGGSSGANKLGIVANANCTETKMALNSRTGQWERVTVQLPEPCVDIVAVGVIAQADPLGAAAIIIGGSVGSFSVNNVRPLAVQPTAQTGTITAILNLTAAPGMTISNVSSDDPAVTTSFSGMTVKLTKTLASLSDSFSAKVSLTSPQAGVAPAVAGALVISSSIPDPYPVNHVTSIFMSSSSSGSRVALPSNGSDVVVAPVKRGH